MSRRGVVAMVLACGLVGAAVEAQDNGIRMVEGSLDLPEGAVPGDLAVIEARDATGRWIGEAVFRIRGQRPPYPFVIAVPEQAQTSLVAALFEDGVARWILTENVTLNGDAPEVLDRAALRAFEDMRITTAYRCGDLMIEAGVFERAAFLRVNGQERILPRVPAASGARFETEDGGTLLWSRGATALLALDGQEFPECSVTPPGAPSDWVARGNEPGWTLSVTGRDFALVYDYGAARSDGTLPRPSLSEGIFSYDSGKVVVDVTPGLCRDDATGMPYPDGVRVTVGDRVLTGCGGDAAETLRGLWSVTAIDDMPVDPTLDVTLDFGQDGALGGHAGCNRYATELRIGGEGVSTGPIAATRMACAEAAMETERRFFAALAAVGRFDFTEDRILVLYEGSGDHPAIRAERAD